MRFHSTPFKSAAAELIGSSGPYSGRPRTSFFSTLVDLHSWTSWKTGCLPLVNNDEPETKTLYKGLRFIAQVLALHFFKGRILRHDTRNNMFSFTICGSLWCVMEWKTCPHTNNMCLFVGHYPFSHCSLRQTHSKVPNHALNGTNFGDFHWSSYSTFLLER